MSFFSVKPLMLKGARLLHPGGASRVVLFSVCSQGMACLAKKDASYRKSVISCRDISGFFAGGVCTLVDLLKCEDGCFTDATARAVYEAALTVQEHMALLVREKQLRCGEKSLCSAERHVLHYFEGNTSWSRFAVDMYFTRLPLAVMRDVADNAAQT